jgi:hypothetical protein
MSCMYMFEPGSTQKIMFSMLASSVVDRVFEPWSGQTKHYKIGMFFFSAEQATFRIKNKDWLVRNQDNVF